MMRSKRQRNRFEPGLETLEDRCTPAVTLNQVGDTLVITGDAAADTVVVTANFNNNFTVVANGAAGQTFNGVRTIQEDLGDGNNMAVLALANSANVTANITTGSGNDLVRVRLGGTLRTNDTLNIRVDTNAGFDDVAFAATTPGQVAGVVPDTYYRFKTHNTVKAIVNLGDDGDAARFYFAQMGREDNVDLAVDTGNGLFNGVLLSCPAIGEDANLNLSVLGGSGADTVTTYLGALSRNSETNLSAILGGGADAMNLSVIWLDQDSELNEKVATGADDDVVRTIIGNSADPLAAGRNWIWANAQVQLDIDLGDGKDIALINVIGIADKNAQITTNVDGGTGTEDSAYFFLGLNRGKTRGTVKGIENLQGGGPGRK